MAKTYEPIATTTLGTAESSVTFGSISGAYTDLVLVSSIKYSTGGINNFATLQVGNGSVDTGSNYSTTWVEGAGGVASSGRQSNGTYSFISYFGSGSSNTTEPVISITNFQNYSNTLTNKTVITRFNNSNQVGAYVGLWRSTSAINTITITANGSNFALGSTFTLYGIASA